MGTTEGDIIDDLQGSWEIDHQLCCTCLEYKPTRHKLQKHPIYTELRYTFCAVPCKLSGGGPQQSWHHLTRAMKETLHSRRRIRWDQFVRLSISTTETLNDLKTDLVVANNNNNNVYHRIVFVSLYVITCLLDWITQAL